MKNYIYLMPGGGPFSRFLQCGIMPLADIEFDNVYLSFSPFNEDNPDDEYNQIAVDYIKQNIHYLKCFGIDRPYDHVAGYVLDQHVDASYEHKGFLPIGPWYSRDNPIEHSPRLADYKRVLNKIHIKNEIKTRVDDLCKLVDIGPHTLGIHVRLTTMTLHDTHMQVNYDDYCRAIDQELETGLYKNIYVATDNVESLIKLEQRYARLIRYYPNLLRLPTENIRGDNQWAWEYDMFFHKRFWQESFMEAMTLARCGGLVCRDSNFSNAAIVFSNSINRVKRVTKSADN